MTDVRCLFQQIVKMIFWPTCSNSEDTCICPNHETNPVTNQEFHVVSQVDAKGCTFQFGQRSWRGHSKLKDFVHVNMLIEIHFAWHVDIATYFCIYIKLLTLLGSKVTKHDGGSFKSDFGLIIFMRWSLHAWNLFFNNNIVLWHDTSWYWNLLKIKRILYLTYSVAVLILEYYYF